MTNATKPKARLVAAGRVYATMKLPKFKSYNNALVIVFDTPQNFKQAIKEGVLIFNDQQDGEK